MGTVQNNEESSFPDDLQDIETETPKLVISCDLIEEEVNEWYRRIDYASNLLQRYKVDGSKQQWDEWKEAVIACIQGLKSLVENRKAVLESWLEAVATQVFPITHSNTGSVECSTEEIERELIDAKMTLAQVEEENVKLEFTYSRLLREGNEVTESTSISESFMERFQSAKQRVQEAETEREKLNEEIERIQSQLFLCRKKNQHLLEEYRALEGQWN
ncbi:hypothetical protein GpartN1_g7315.t1 [Galdieria partita]|uniref:Uncharacterized protein n=1 Tax=Galdieria partita TaxID=83374 RepID=A0A9C7Q3A7_9RHOD|nr:hypothetical protein GpartN1_g7315.t1 [Galdieria partita]